MFKGFERNISSMLPKFEKELAYSWNIAEGHWAFNKIE